MGIESWDRLGGRNRRRRLGRVLASFVSVKSGANQPSVNARICLAEPFHRLRQFDKSSCRRLLQHANRANYGQTATYRGIAPGPVVHQYGICVDFLRQADCLQFSDVHVQREIR